VVGNKGYDRALPGMTAASVANAYGYQKVAARLRTLLS
jgi:hypothetical protein